jgi:predicted transposase/invertase (TIGR01784 family)
LDKKIQKAKTVEPKGGSDNHVNDKGYKKLFENKEMFVEFLKTFVKEGWVEDIDEKDLIRIDKEFILVDNRSKEADIVYRMKLKNEQEVIFYILLELQSTVDRMMPYRLLIYMTQIWKNILSSVKESDANKEEYRLPAIVPLVLYNGENKWSAPLRFKDFVSEAARFDKYLVDFQYILVSANDYDPKELLRIGNAISLIIRMDQKLEKDDKDGFQERFKEILRMQDTLPTEKMRLICDFVFHVVAKKFKTEEEQEMFKKQINDYLKEGIEMTYALEKALDNIEQKGIEQGREEKAISMARKMLADGEPIEKIVRYSELSESEVFKLKEEELAK